MKVSNPESNLAASICEKSLSFNCHYAQGKYHEKNTTVECSHGAIVSLDLQAATACCWFCGLQYNDNNSATLVLLPPHIVLHLPRICRMITDNCENNIFRL